MNILILHHFSDYWSDGMASHKTSYEDELEKVIDYLRNEKIHKIILPLYESNVLLDCHKKLSDVCCEENIEIDIHSYGYNWKKDHVEFCKDEDLGITWCQGQREDHGDNDVVLIANWMHDLKGNNIIIAGSFEGECVNDLETALSSAGINYKKESTLVVGAYQKYNFRGIY
jgi:hypothetical protein